MKIKFFPITLGPMRKLTLRGLALKEKLEKKGLRVFETYPGAAQDIWGIPRQKDLEGLKKGLKRFRLGGNWLRPGVTRDELDALTCALVAREDLRGNTMVLGDPEEGLMILPRKKAQGSKGKAQGEGKGQKGKGKRRKEEASRAEDKKA